MLDMADFSPRLPPSPLLPKMTSGWSLICTITGPCEETTDGELWASGLFLRRKGILRWHHGPSHLSLTINSMCSLASLFWSPDFCQSIPPFSSSCWVIQWVVDHNKLCEDGGEPGAPSTMATGPHTSLCQSRMIAPWLSKCRCFLEVHNLLHAIPRKMSHWFLMSSGFPKSTACFSPYQLFIVKSTERIRSSAFALSIFLLLQLPTYYQRREWTFLLYYICLLYSRLMMGLCIS